MTFVRALFEKRFPDRLVRKEGDIAVTYLFAEGFGFHHIFFFQKGRNYDYWYEENKMMPRYTTLNKLADALDVKITTLYNDEKDKADGEAAAEENTADTPPENNVPPDTLHRFAEQFKFLREEGGLSFDDIAEATDIPADMLETFENEDNYPNIVVLECLANYFGVTTDYLLGKPFLSEQECRFLKFVSHPENLTELHYKNILPTELYVLCRNSLVADFI